MADLNEKYGTAPTARVVLNRSPSYRPVPKVQAATAGNIIAGACVTIIVGILKRRGVVIEPEEAAALVLIIGSIFTFGAGYLTKPQGGIFSGDEPPSGGEYVGTSHERRIDRPQKGPPS